MASKFFEGREVVKAEGLTGPRVYSTDLLPSLYDPANSADSVILAARSLKIKIITKGLVTLNSAYLVSPLAVKLLEAHPDLLMGDAILPAFRDDKSSLSDLIPSASDLSASGIDTARLSDHISELERQIRRVMPWELADVAESFRAAIISRLRNHRSVIVRLLASHGVSAAEIESIARAIEALDLRNSVNLRNYISTLSTSIRAPLSKFASACYHMVGTGVVRCETGTDLNPLSEFKAADLVLAARDTRPEALSDEAIFLEAFMGYALDAIQTSVIPSQVIDSLSFGTAHQLSRALRAQGFQTKYDEITRQYFSLPDRPEDALDAIDEEGIASAAEELIAIIQKEILAELPDYKTAVQSEAKENLYRAGGDILRDAVKALPVVGHCVAVIDVGANASSALSSLLSVRDQGVAFKEAHKQKAEKIRNGILGLQTSSQKKTKLLDVVALLSDIHGITIQRA